ncbi:MAG: dihydroneopterin aldolase [Gemmatimonadota bacterium]|nr:dihydroneopterin aldolase [Gemmatimonadota bacterium]MDE3171842.1 dihydroneopterin aldolase [Gemmatimonadota bacterium]
MTGTPLHDRITLRGMRFHVLVGILAHEREYPQPLEVDLTAWIAPGRTGIVDYRGLHDAARRAVDDSPRKYLEEIAERVAAAALAVAGVERVDVAVRKPHVPLGAPLDTVEVAIRRPLDG